MKLYPKLIRPGAAFLSERVDELAEDIHAVLDGGLDAGNIAAGVTLPRARFAEQRSTFILRGMVGSSSELVLGQLWGNARLLGFSLWPTAAAPWGDEVPPTWEWTISTYGYYTASYVLPETPRRKAGELILLPAPMPLEAATTIKASAPGGPLGGASAIISAVFDCLLEG